MDRERYLLASAVLLLAPETALIFQGQEFASSSPFLYFTDHDPELGRLVTEGRRSEFGEFAAFADSAKRESTPDPQAEATFARSRLDFRERESHADVYETYRKLLALRRTDLVFSRADREAMRTLTIGNDVLAIHRWHGHEQRLVLLNFGKAEATLSPSQIPELPDDIVWRMIWSSAEQGLPTGKDRPWLLRPRSGVVLNCHPEASALQAGECDSAD